MGVWDGVTVWMAGAGVAVRVEVGDGSTIWVGCAGVNVRVAVDVTGMGVREEVPVSVIFIDIGVESGRDDWQAVRARTKTKSKHLSNIIP